MHPVLDNPFYVLELGPEASDMDVERAGKKLLGMFELGLARARQYGTPLGPRQRTEESVRYAVSQLRDPGARLLHEIWAAVDPGEWAGADGATRSEEDALRWFRTGDGTGASTEESGRGRP